MALICCAVVGFGLKKLRYPCERSNGENCLLPAYLNRATLWICEGKVYRMPPRRMIRRTILSGVREIEQVKAGAVMEASSNSPRSYIRGGLRFYFLLWSGCCALYDMRSYPEAPHRCPNRVAHPNLLRHIRRSDVYTNHNPSNEHLGPLKTTGTCGHVIVTVTTFS